MEEYRLFFVCGDAQSGLLNGCSRGGGVEGCDTAEEAWLVSFCAAFTDPQQHTFQTTMKSTVITSVLFVDV